MQQTDLLQSESVRRLSVEALLAWGFGSLIASALLASALAFGVWRITFIAFEEYEQQDSPIALNASNGVDAWLDIGRHAELFILTSETVEGIARSRPYVSLWQADLANLNNYLAQIRSTGDNSDQEVLELLPELEASLDRYDADFLAIVNQTEFLRNENTGLDAAIEMEEQALDMLLDEVNHPELSASLLRLKDIQMNFIVTHGESDIEKFAAEIGRFMEINAASSRNESLSMDIQRYQRSFEQYVASERELDARKLDFMGATARIEELLESLEQRALLNSHETLQALERRIINVTLASALVALIVALAGATIALIIGSRIRIAAQRVIGFAARVAAGRLDTRLLQVDSGKFGALELALNTMADRLQESDEHMNHQARRLEMSNRRIALLSELTGMLQTAVSSDEAIGIIACHLDMMVLAQGGTLYIFNDSRNCLEAVARWGGQQSGDDVAPLDCWAFRRGQIYGSIEGTPLACAHVKYDEDQPLYLCLPLITQGGILGLVHIRFASDDTGILEEEARFARRLSEQLGLALANLKLRDALHTQSVTDVLTGLFNRRFLEEALARELARATREHTQVAVLMIDADHFKRYNDTHGHDAGDAALRQLGMVLTGNCRPFDLVCRYGGEEFIAVLPTTAEQGAEAWAHRLLELVRQMHISSDGKPLPGLTVSIGIAVYPANGDSVEKLLKQADLALYEAKHGGRDRAVLKE